MKRLSDNAFVWLMIVLLPVLAIAMGIGALLLQRAVNDLHVQVNGLGDDIDRTFGRVEDKVDSRGDGLLRQLQDSIKRLEDLNRRLEDLDRKLKDTKDKTDELNRQMEGQQ